MRNVRNVLTTRSFWIATLIVALPGTFAASARADTSGTSAPAGGSTTTTPAATSPQGGDPSSPTGGTTSGGTTTTQTGGTPAPPAPATPGTTPPATPPTTPSGGTPAPAAPAPATPTPAPVATPIVPATPTTGGNGSGSSNGTPASTPASTPIVPPVANATQPSPPVSPTPTAPVAAIVTPTAPVATSVPSPAKPVTAGPTPTQQQAASATQQLTVLGNQLQAVAPLGPGVQTLIAQLVSLTHSDPAVSALLVQLQQVGSSSPTVGSLVARVALLNRLLARLTLTDPQAARNLARGVSALHSLLIDLLQGGALARWQLLGTHYVAPTAPATLAALGGSGALMAGFASLAPSAEQPAAQPAPAPLHKRAFGARPVAPASSVVFGRFGPVSTPLASGAAAVGSGGGIGSSAPAIALLAVLAVWFLNFMSGRVALDLVPWRSTLLAMHLERPG